MRKIFMASAICLIAVFMVSFIPLAAHAQAPAGRRYKVDMAIDLNWNGLDIENIFDTDLNIFTVALDVGYFITEMFEIGPEIVYSKMEILDDYDITTWSLVVKGNAHFSTGGQITPYVGLRLGVSNIDLDDVDDTAFCYGAQFGLDYFLNQNVSVNPELRYTRTTYDFEGLDVDSDDIALMIGFGVHF